MTDPRILGQPLTLPCGVVLRNRLAKSSMSDSLGDGAGDSTEPQARLYERWAEGGVAVSFIGEVQCDHRYPEKPGNLVLGPHSDPARLKALVARATVDGAHLWPQLGHAGALSHAPISRPAGPSPLDLEGLRCEGLSAEEVRAVPALFAAAAEQARAAGFTGVHVHAGHGFLLSQFLSPLFNHRTDGYGGSVERRARLVLETVAAVRAAVGLEFPVGLRMNATDQLEGGLTETESLAVVRLLADSTLDLLDVSGGTYFPGAPSSSEATGAGAWFAEFGRRARSAAPFPVMVTGGFKRRDQAVQAVESGAADVVGLARALVVEPDLANTWLTPAGGDPAFPRFAETVPGGVTAWYTMRLAAIGEDAETAFDMTLPDAVSAYEQRDAARCVRWLERFGPASGGSLPAYRPE